MGTPRPQGGPEPFYVATFARAARCFLFKMLYFPCESLARWFKKNFPTAYKHGLPQEWKSIGN